LHADLIWSYIFERCGRLYSEIFRSIYSDEVFISYTVNVFSAMQLLSSIEASRVYIVYVNLLKDWIACYAML